MDQRLRPESRQELQPGAQHTEAPAPEWHHQLSTGWETTYAQAASLIPEMVAKGARATVRATGRSTNTTKAPAGLSGRGAVWPCAVPAGENSFTQADVNHPYRRRFK